MICFVTKEHEKRIKERLPQEDIYFAGTIPEFSSHITADSFPAISHELVTENKVNDLIKILEIMTFTLSKLRILFFLNFSFKR